MKVSEFLKKHILTDDWDVAEGSKLHCSCGWEDSFSGPYKDNLYKFDDHIDAEAELATIGHIPAVITQLVDEMVENRRNWCRDARTYDAENHQMNRIFKDLYAQAEIMANPDASSGDIHYKWMKEAGPLGI